MPRNKYPEETVQKILDAALKLFLEKGYEKTTILDIVENMGGLTRGAFYHHFKSKEEVLNAVTDRLFYEQNPFHDVAGMPNMTGLEKLKYSLKHQFHFENPEYQPLVVALMSLVEKNPQFIMHIFLENRKSVERYIQPLIEEGIADGSIRPNNAKLVGELMQLAGNIWMNPYLFPMTETEALEKLMLLKQILDGLGVPVFDEEVLSHFINADWDDFFEDPATEE
ncbi:MAG: TetR/AcrR family transcriptional regulator [Oscillospiraceae bacterium]|nr:TetR/AcrR family transcriptional regulator [Oscillospiraceae bacterium]